MPSLPLSFVVRVRANTRTAARKPLGYTIDKVRRVIIIDLLCLEEPRVVVEALGEVLLDRDFDSSYHIIIDCRALTPVPSRERVAALAARLARLDLHTFGNSVTLVTRTPEAHIAAEEGCDILRRTLNIELRSVQICRDLVDAVALAPHPR